MAQAAEQPRHETRATPWIDVSERPEWADGSITAYRIWQRLSQWGWEQSHEWRNRDGHTWREAWTRSVAGWLPSAQHPA